jgi:hypothetical protein
MMFASSLTLYSVIKAALQRLRTRTIANPSSKGPAASYNSLDLFNNKLNVIDALSKALKKEKRILTKKIALCCLEIEVKDL